VESCRSAADQRDTAFAVGASIERTLTMRVLACVVLLLVSAPVRAELVEAYCLYTKAGSLRMPWLYDSARECKEHLRWVESKAEGRRLHENKVMKDRFGEFLGCNCEPAGRR
jgi:hypothetical protein